MLLEVTDPNTSVRRVWSVKLSKRQLEYLFAAPDPSLRGQVLQVRELVSTVGPDNEENIELVPVKAAMGYWGGLAMTALLRIFPPSGCRCRLCLKTASTACFRP